MLGIKGRMKYVSDQIYPVYQIKDWVVHEKAAGILMYEIDGK